jgi:hypothetical protein
VCVFYGAVFWNPGISREVSIANKFTGKLIKELITVHSHILSDGYSIVHSSIGF